MAFQPTQKVRCKRSPKYRPFVTRMPVFFAIVTTLLNDHVLKHSFLAGWFTGKLSDFSGLFFFPFFLYDAFSLLLPKVTHRYRQIILAVSLLATGLVFCLLKTSGSFYAAYQSLFRSVFGIPIRDAQDPTDLLALSSFVLVVIYFRKVINSQQKED